MLECLWIFWIFVLLLQIFDSLNPCSFSLHSFFSMNVVFCMLLKHAWTCLCSAGKPGSVSWLDHICGLVFILPKNGSLSVTLLSILAWLFSIFFILITAAFVLFDVLHSIYWVCHGPYTMCDLCLSFVLFCFFNKMKWHYQHVLACVWFT